jgi:cephalosporin hydroxylase
MKKILSRNEFEKVRQNNASRLFKNRKLHKKALQVKVEANNRYYWVSLTNWFGEPCLQLTQDLFAFQEIIYKTRPDIILEIGVAWGGSTLFYLNLCKTLGLKGVVGVDIFIPKDLRQRLIKKKPKNTFLKLIQGSSIDQKTMNQVKKIVKGKKVFIILDSNHTHDHVLSELNFYSKLMKKGQYLICGDTIIANQPQSKKRPREWNKKNNPMTALKLFLKDNKQFVIDKKIERKMLITNMPDGYLKKI